MLSACAFHTQEPSSAEEFQQKETKTSPYLVGCGVKRVAFSLVSFVFCLAYNLWLSPVPLTVSSLLKWLVIGVVGFSHGSGALCLFCDLGCFPRHKLR